LVAELAGPAVEVLQRRGGELGRGRAAAEVLTEQLAGAAEAAADGALGQLERGAERL
jgi:hypothetical protein